MKRVCSEPHCYAAIQHHNKSGKCNRHFVRARKHEVQPCVRCKQALHATTKGDMCGCCRSAIAQSRRCTVCDKRLSAGNKSMLCSVHYAESLGRKAAHSMSFKAALPFQCKHVMAATANVMSITAENMTGPCRDAYFVTARQIYSAICREHYSYPHIGRTLSRDHSTIIHAVERANARKGDLHFARLMVLVRDEAIAIKAGERAAIAAHVERLAA